MMSGVVIAVYFDTKMGITIGIVGLGLGLIFENVHALRIMKDPQRLIARRRR
jgi:hypothetical protein